MTDQREMLRRVVLDRLEILDGFSYVIDAPHEFLDVVLAAADHDAAREAICRRWGVSGIQAQAMLDLQVRRWTRQDVDRIHRELAECREHLEQLERESD